MMEAKIRHLEIIRAAISEAAGNSLRIKGFAMLLLAGSLALRDGVSGSALGIGTILILVTIVLGLLDFYYNQQSDLFKILYNEVRVRGENDIDFSMEVNQYSDELYQLYKGIWPFPVAATICLYTFILVFLIFGMLLYTQDNIP